MLTTEHHRQDEFAQLHQRPCESVLSHAFSESTQDDKTHISSTALGGVDQPLREVQVPEEGIVGALIERLAHGADICLALQRVGDVIGPVGEEEWSSLDGSLEQAEEVCFFGPSFGQMADGSFVGGINRIDAKVLSVVDIGIEDASNTATLSDDDQVIAWEI